MHNQGENFLYNDILKEIDTDKPNQSTTVKSTYASLGSVAI